MAYTLLQMITTIQKKLRLPESVDINDSHAQLLTEFINYIQKDIMAEQFTWEELKRNGYFDTVASTSTYTIAASASYEIRTIKNMYIAGYTPIQRLSDYEFQMARPDYTEEGQPLAYRHYEVSASGIIVEMLPTPDAVYRVYTEIMLKCPLLSAATDTPVLPDRLIIQGAKMLAQEERGDIPDMDMAGFKALLTGYIDNELKANRHRKLVYKDI